MQPIQLYELVEISNNSRITNEVLFTINSKLTPAEIRAFRIWLHIIKESK